MIRDFKISDELHIGYYASLITSAFAMAQFISGKRKIKNNFQRFLEDKINPQFFFLFLFGYSNHLLGIPWGSLSDRIGRKPVVLMGLASTSLGVFLFGLSKSFAWALATKIFSGIFVSREIGYMYIHLSYNLNFKIEWQYQRLKKHDR